ncbi:xanthine dehydrogenase family protein subunit M [Micromonospora sp. Llam7]|uniref:FAD binding domain-containing protein n=1 Tax=Micromonospora tarapacensis TaxID=2835305 RepID=UPI001C830E83|nr:xanthine dehydrogenase family protein subunit M [Micromonospora tarapacensis]MBX7267746.1 xanthine dehydrogenase family protein subunit M [Micromonospora tarapacensis]
MRAFEYLRPGDVDTAVTLVRADPAAQYLAGGTTQVDLMLKDGILDPERVVDITRLPLRGITADERTLRVGALTTMEELAADPTVARRLPLVRTALLAGASTQLRNMSTIGGNLLQRTRCRYFRDPTVPDCNKRAPGSGCAAITGAGARMHAILGAGENCIALHASDLCVPLVALDAVVRVRGGDGERAIPLTEFYVLPGDRPDVETVLRHGDLITAVEVPLLPAAARSVYLKIRDRASYEFALVSVAAALTIEDGVVTEARMGLGGVGTIPWRARAAEQVLTGGPATVETYRAAAVTELRDPFTVPGTGFKPELARRTIVRALETVAGGPT